MLHYANGIRMAQTQTWRRRRQLCRITKCSCVSTPWILIEVDCRHINVSYADHETMHGQGLKSLDIVDTSLLTMGSISTKL